VWVIIANADLRLVVRLGFVLPNSVPRYDEGSDRAIVLQFCTNSEAEAGTIS
jgi:hypothetical protein